ncbi:branched-chain-amino-acid transaminase [Limibacter armeniacum]|uniref:branched-chain-amino-acid transaminase n=1 Tax=Limibacter armeniacum TaxID=466084 RepID=UPI002FE510BD
MKYFDEETVVFHNGKFIKAKDAGTDLYSQSLHYGNSVFDAMRAYDTALGAHVFKAHQHYKRFKESAERMCLTLPYSVEELVSITYALLEENNFSDAYIRPMVYAGANLELTPTEQSGLFIAAWKWDKYLGKDLLDVTVSSYSRPSPKSCHVESKIAGNYASATVALAEAKRNGFDDALMLDVDGNVAEGTGANFFFEIGNRLFTPQCGHIFPGITRQTVLEISQSLGIEVVEGKFRPADLNRVDGAFFAGTAAQITGIRSINGNPMRKKWENTIGYTIFEKYGHIVTQNEYDGYSII